MWKIIEQQCPEIKRQTNKIVGSLYYGGQRSPTNRKGPLTVDGGRRTQTMSAFKSKKLAHKTCVWLREGDNMSTL